jgi:hypothetical protein
VGTQLAEAQWRGDFPKEGHHVHMLDETLQYKRSLIAKATFKHIAG